MRRLVGPFIAISTLALITLFLPVASSAPATAPVAHGVVPATWQIVPTPPYSFSTETSYNAISCVGPMFCMAVGNAHPSVSSDLPIAGTWDRLDVARPDQPRHPEQHRRRI